VLRFYRDQYRGRIGKIFFDSVFGVEKWYSLLWVVFISALSFLTRPVQARIMGTWEGWPIWVIPVFVMASVVVLFVRGLLKENMQNILKLNQELQAERDATGAERETRQALEKKWADKERRKALKNALQHAHLEGKILHDEGPTQERVKDWAYRVAVMITVALDTGEVGLFYNDFDVSVAPVADDSEVKQSIRRRLKNIRDLKVRVDRDSLDVSPDFHAREWIIHHPPRINVTRQTQDVSQIVNEIERRTNRQ
jgi:hypothetical protein